MRMCKLLAGVMALMLLLSACTAAPESPGKTSGPTDPVPPVTEPAKPATTGAGREETAEPISGEPSELTLPELPPITAAGSYESLVARLRADLEQADDLVHSAVLPEDDPGSDLGAEDTGSGRPVPGTERAEFAKSDGRYLYVLDSYGLTILSAAGKDSQILSYTQIQRQSGFGGSGWLEGLYVWQDRVAVIYSLSEYGPDEAGNWFDATATHVSLLDVSDRSDPVLLAAPSVDGVCLDTRMVDGTLYLFTNYYPQRLSAEGEDPARCVPGVTVDGSRSPIEAENIYLCPEPSGVCFTVAAALDVENGSFRSALAFTDATDALCMSRSDLYLARSLRSVARSEAYQDGPYTVIGCRRQLQTELKRLTREEDGSLRFAGSAQVPGGVVSQNALDLHDDLLRVAAVEESVDYGVYTDEAHGWTNYAPGEVRRSGAVTVLDRNLKQVGSLSGLQLSGKRYSDCRYLDNALCLILSAENGSMDVVDLTRPEQPVVSGEQELPGSSLCLCSYGPELLLGFGDAWPEQGLQICLFRFGGGELHAADSRSLPTYDYSPAVVDPAVLLTVPAQGLLGLPVEGTGPENYVLFSISNEAIAVRGSLQLEYLPAEAHPLVVDGVLYLCSSGITYAVELSSMELLAEVSNAEG